MTITLKKRKTEVLSRDGVPLCEVSITLPHAEGEETKVEALNRFYQALAEGAMALGRDPLLPLAASAFEASNDPRRRLTHRPYRLILHACLQESDEGVVVLRTLTLSHRGRTLSSRTWEERILADGRVVPQGNRKENRQ